MGYLSYEDHQAHEESCDELDERMSEGDGSDWANKLVLVLLEDARKSYRDGSQPIGQVFLDPRRSDWERKIADLYDYGRGYTVVVKALLDAAAELDNSAEVTVFAMSSQTSYGQFPKPSGLVVTVTIPAVKFVLEGVVQ
jgi:hypothetical protein